MPYAKPVASERPLLCDFCDEALRKGLGVVQTLRVTLDDDAQVWALGLFCGHCWSKTCKKRKDISDHWIVQHPSLGKAHSDLVGLHDSFWERVKLHGKNQEACDHCGKCKKPFIPDSVQPSKLIVQTGEGSYRYEAVLCIYCRQDWGISQGHSFGVSQFIHRELGNAFFEEAQQKGSLITENGSFGIQQEVN